MSTAKSAYPTRISWNGNNIAEVTDVSSPETTVSMHEVTSNDSNGWVEKIAGLISGSEFSIKGNFYEGDTDGQIAIYADHLSRTAREVIVSLPTSFGSTFTALCVCTKFKLVTPMDGAAASFEASFEPIGVVTFMTEASAGLTTPFFVVSESGVIAPTAASDVYSYVVTVLTGISSVTITPTALVGVITVNGCVVASGEASSAIALGSAGSVTEVTIVVSEPNKSPKTYVLYVARAAA